MFIYLYNKQSVFRSVKLKIIIKETLFLEGNGPPNCQFSSPWVGRSR